MSNIKRILALLLVLILMFSLSACAKDQKPAETESTTTIETTTSTTEPTYADDVVKSYKQLCVDIGTDNGGSYCMWSDADISYDADGNVYAIYLYDPTLLAFQVSDTFEGGVGVMDGVDVEKVLAILENYIDQKNMTGDAPIEDIYEVLEIMKFVPVITGAST